MENKTGLSAGDRDDIKVCLLTAGSLLAVMARRTKSPLDDKLARALIAAGTTDTALLDKLLDVFDSSVKA